MQSISRVCVHHVTDIVPSEQGESLRPGDVDACAHGHAISVDRMTLCSLLAPSCYKASEGGPYANARRACVLVTEDPYGGREMEGVAAESPVRAKQRH